MNQRICIELALRIYSDCIECMCCVCESLNLSKLRLN